MNEYVIILDVGKKETKTMGKKLDSDTSSVKKINFKTKMYDLNKGYIDVEGDSYNVKLEGKELIVGEQGIDDSNETSKTNFLHKVSAYTAITQYLDPETKDNKVNIVLACPLSVLRIKAAKEEYKNYIKGNGEINIEVNGKKYTFTIENIMIKAEGSGILYTNKEMFLNQNIAIIDFGGLNMGFSLYRNAVCSPDERFIEEHGVNKLIKMIKIALEGLNNGNLISYTQAEEALNNGYMTKLGEIDVASADVIKEVKQEFLNKAIEIIARNSFRLEQYDGIVFVGGTTQKLREQILAKFPNATIPLNSQWSTVEGLYIVGCRKYSK